MILLANSWIWNASHSKRCFEDSDLQQFKISSIWVGSISSRLVRPRSFAHTTAGSLVCPIVFLTNQRLACTNRAGGSLIGQFSFSLTKTAALMAAIFEEKFSAAREICFWALRGRLHHLHIFSIMPTFRVVFQMTGKLPESFLCWKKTSRSDS